MVRERANQVLGAPTKTIDLGSTELPEEFFMDTLRELVPRFQMNTYNVLTNNCNNFTDECAHILLGEGIPKEIVNLPQEFLSTPMGQQMAPMLQAAQQNLMVNSHPIFDSDQGEMPPPLNVQPQMPSQQNLPPSMGMPAESGEPAGNGGNMPNLNELANNPMVQNMMNQYGMGGQDLN